MEKVRGFLYFENRDFYDMKEYLKDFSVEGMRYKFFNGLARAGKKIDMPGIFLDGNAKVKDKGKYSAEMVKFIRNKLGLRCESKNCDVSSAVGGEDYILHIKKGDLKGKYLGIRILPPYNNIIQLRRASSDLGTIVNADDVLLRGVEKINEGRYKGTDKRCVDLIGAIDFKGRKKKIESYLKSKDLKLEGYTFLDLID